MGLAAQTKPPQPPAERRDRRGKGWRGGWRAGEPELLAHSPGLAAAPERGLARGREAEAFCDLGVAACPGRSGRRSPNTGTGATRGTRQQELPQESAGDTVSSVCAAIAAQWGGMAGRYQTASADLKVQRKKTGVS